MLKFMKRCLILLMVASLLPNPGFAYEVPRQDSKTKYFYVFGPEGNVLDGKESDEFRLFIDLPAATEEPLTIKIFDPNTGGVLDAGVAPWNTKMEFSVSGTSELDKEVFGYASNYDNKDYAFGPYTKEQGKKIGNRYRFTLTVKALQGDDLNLFNVKISPDSAESFSDKFTFVLLPAKDDKMYFYPEIPAGIRTLTARNFDLDPDGGVSRLYDPATKKSYSINESQSGKWAETKIPIQSDSSRRLEYRVTTTNQINGHAGVQFLDDKGQTLPIYFRKGAKPQPVEKEKPAPAPAPKTALACNQFTFDARKSHDAEKANLTYLWNFGDGSTSEEPYVEHVYEKGGAYNVTLTVSDNSGLKCEKSRTAQKINVNTPPKAVLSGKTLACVGEEVSLDASSSKDENSEKLTYRWEFGDGTQGEGAQVSKVYSKGGVYNVALTVDDNAGSSCSLDSAKHVIKVNTPPEASAGKAVSLCLRDPNEAFNVTFDGSRSSDNDRDSLTYTWDFGDDTQGEGAKVTHEYKQAGDYTAKLSVTDNSGSTCAVAVDSIPVKLNKAPLAVAGKDISTCAGSTVTFDGSDSVTSGADAVYHWDFGDGKTAAGKVVEHSYEKGGNYTATLTVDNGTGGDCSKSSATRRIYVNGAPQASVNSVQTSCVGDKVDFDASGSSDPDGNRLKYSWNFGDGTTWEGGSKVTHKYEKGGRYKVTVSVDDGSNSACSSSTKTTMAKVNAPPVANAGPNLTCCTADVTPFDGSGSKDPDNDRLKYSWNFGDGQTSSSPAPSHAYERSGSYKVVLTVDDGSGTQCSQSSSSFVADVNSQPVSVIEIKQK